MVPAVISILACFITDDFEHLFMFVSILGFYSYARFYIFNIYAYIH